MVNIILIKSVMIIHFGSGSNPPLLYDSLTLKRFHSFLLGHNISSQFLKFSNPELITFIQEIAGPFLLSLHNQMIGIFFSNFVTYPEKCMSLLPRHEREETKYYSKLKKIKEKKREETNWQNKHKS